MIIWINGAFGSGKTQTAHELQRRIPQSFIFDPEETGFYIRKQLPTSLQVADFQNIELWRTFNYYMLKEIASTSNDIIIVPMTIVEPLYFNEIIGKLRADGIIVHHFTLSASEATILRRLKKRGEGSRSWAALQIKRCIAGFQNPIFADMIITDECSIEEVVEQIAAQVQISLLPDERGKARKLFDRMKVQWEHIRLFK